MARECNSEYCYDLVKGCRYMRLLKSGEARCKCVKDCATCTFADRLLMHPELNQITELSRQGGTNEVGRPARVKEE